MVIYSDTIQSARDTRLEIGVSAHRNEYPAVDRYGVLLNVDAPGITQNVHLGVIDAERLIGALQGAIDALRVDAKPLAQEAAE